MKVHELEGILRFERERAGGIIIEYPRLVMKNEGEWCETGAALVDWLRFIQATDKKIKIKVEVDDYPTCRPVI